MSVASAARHSDSARRSGVPTTVPCAYCDLPVRIKPQLGEEIDFESQLYCCYGCRFAADITRARGEQGQATLILTRLGISVFLSMSVMIFTLFLYSRDTYFTVEDEASLTAGALTSLMRYASLLFTAPVFVLLGFPLIDNSIEQWKRGIASTDALVVVGVGAAFAFSSFNTFSERGHTYFETVCMVLVLVTLGRWLEASAKLRAADAAKSLSGLLPATAIIERNGKQVEVPVSELEVGFRILVPAGQRIVADGIITGGRAGVDESMVTGESEPQIRETGDPVMAGTIAIDGALTIRATAVGRESTIGRIEALLDRARQQRGHYQRLADRIASWFLPLTVGTAIIVGIIVSMTHSVETGVMRALSVLLIACPCALGIATPTAIWAALGRAGRMGALCTNPEALERLDRIKAIAFDKTGTLTQDESTVERLDVDAATSVPAVLQKAADLATTSHHVVSQSIANYAKTQNIFPVASDNVCTIPGRGVQAEFNATKVCLGNVAFLTESGFQFSAELELRVKEAIDAGRSICCIGWGGLVRGVFVLSERLRDHAPVVLEEIQRLPLHSVVLTGDHARRGRLLSRELGIDVRPELRPADKVESLQSLRQSIGPVAMIGDGVNDAPALATADVGIALGCGADIARDAADISILSDDLRLIPALIRLAHQTVRTIRVNLFWAFAFNIVGVALAAAGMLAPIFAAIAMVLSSVLVVGNSMRLAADESTDVAGTGNHMRNSNLSRFESEDPRQPLNRQARHATTPTSISVQRPHA